MNKNQNSNLSQKESLENIINSFLSKNASVNDDSKEKILNLINCLSQDDIKKITELTQSGQLQKIANTLINNKGQKR